MTTRKFGHRLFEIFQVSSELVRPLTLKRTTIPPKPLGRWCHQEYSDTCDIDKKVDLANSDNSFTTWTDDPSTPAKSQ